MEKNNFWNDAAKYGAIIGALLAASFIVENLLTLSGQFYVMGLVWLAVAVAHYYLLHRYTRSRSRLYSAEEGFTFGQAYSYVLTLSGFAGVIVGIVQVVYLHLVIGYSNYIDKYIASLNDFLSSRGGVPASMEELLSQTFAELQNAPTPSVLSTCWSGILTSLVFGAFFGLIIAGVLSRAPKPFESQNE